MLELIREDGKSPYEEWFLSLDPLAAAKVTVAKVRMEQGNLSNVKWFSGIGEYKIDWGPGSTLPRRVLGSSSFLEVVLKKDSKGTLNGL
ncbi:hypothetical protein [Geobacter hydrogenophilus]|uniref:hypothetical protein n=1 Tax=Geobacter hydrogenophilus TaxID=40983 RepID=UPI001FE9F202|nr:hypothetical protein [Geobacter hydrogenophilus]